MEISVLLIFMLVYFGMALGNLPGLALDRTGIALLGAIAVIEVKELSLQEAVNNVDLPSIAILFSFMIISGQFYYSGFYTSIAARMERWNVAPSFFLLAIILISGILSAVLINDIVCLAMTPLLIKICFHKQFNPVPFLIGLACGSNIGSAITLIGNPQNMLIGEVLHMSFNQYMLDAIIPCTLGLFSAWWVIKRQTGNDWIEERLPLEVDAPSYDRWQSWKGTVVLLLLISIFLFIDLPREHVSIMAAGCLLLSRQMASRMMLNFIDWQLLVLFIGLFIVNQEFNRLEIVQSFLTTLENNYVNLSSAPVLFTASAILSNLISNVPAVMLLLPFASSYMAGALLALSSSLAGNMFVIGSIANIIVITQASNAGIQITWKQHMAYGLPISFISLALAALWLYSRYAFIQI